MAENVIELFVCERTDCFNVFSEEMHRSCKVMKDPKLKLLFKQNHPHATHPTVRSLWQCR
jgi:hypothetical protein